jgi:hypothetical protein
VKRRQKRKIVLVILATVLAAMGLWYWNYTQTRSLSIDLTIKPADTLVAPQYLFSFAGTKTDRLTSPVGVLADGGDVFVADSTGGQLFAFKQDGTFIRTFGKDQLIDPIYIAKNPNDGLLYVTDRGRQGVYKYKTTGEFVGVFDPNLPKAERPSFETTSQWIPIAITFAPDGRMFVTDILKDQRMLIFGADGSFTKSVGTMGVAQTASDLPGQFQFPNSLKVLGDEVWVVDSNNRRMEIFGLDGTYKRLLPLAGLPRGLVFLPRSSGATAADTDAYVVVDALASMCTLYTTSSLPQVTFGEKGTGDGQFSLPNDVTVGDKSVVFVSDNKNFRVQAWGWQANVSPIPKVLPKQSAWLLLLLPLLLVPLFFRKKKFYATADFIEAMATAGALSQMRDKRRSWLVSEEDYAALRTRAEGELKLSEMLHATEYSDTDARALASRYATTLGQAAILTSARRTKLFCTENEELRKLARLLEIDAVNAEEFRARFASKKR